MSNIGGKGIILAGGKGSRLFPSTKVVSKQLLPIYDKPMIYYPLSTLIESGIANILIISSPQHLYKFEELLSDGSQWGVNITYRVQPEPEGIAQCFVLAEDFVGDDRVCLMLGDNFIDCKVLPNFIRTALQKKENATIFAYKVAAPQEFGVVQFNEDGVAVSLEEKPKNPKSNYAVPGIYVYGKDVVDIAKNLKKSARGEYEITDVNQKYLSEQRLDVNILPDDSKWFDTGTQHSLLEASQYVFDAWRDRKVNVGCVEEAAYNSGFIDENQLDLSAESMHSSPYGEYLKSLLDLKN